jgi:hypothetical protein
MKLSDEKFQLSSLVDELSRTLKMGDKSKKYMIELCKDLVND